MTSGAIRIVTPADSDCAMSLEVAMPTRVQQGVILALAAVLVAAGVGGGQWFMNADYVVYGYSVRLLHAVYSSVFRYFILLMSGNVQEFSVFM